ncbi:hypothetical protein ACPCBC_15295 [Streptomyces incarnatus]
MTGTGLTIRAVPGADFLAGCIVSTWLDMVAFLLIGHAPPRYPGETADSIEVGLMGMVDAMGLRPAFETVPVVGLRIVMRGPYVALDYGHPTVFMQVPTGGDAWRSHLNRGGPALLVVALDPIPPGAGPDALANYLDRVASTRRAYAGATALRNQ